MNESNTPLASAAATNEQVVAAVLQLIREENPEVVALLRKILREKAAYSADYPENISMVAENTAVAYAPGQHLAPQPAPPYKTARRAKTKPKKWKSGYTLDGRKLFYDYDLLPPLDTRKYGISKEIMQQLQELFSDAPPAEELLKHLTK